MIRQNRFIPCFAFHATALFRRLTNDSGIVTPALSADESIAHIHTEPYLSSMTQPQTAYLVSCVSQKCPRAAPAKDFYISPWFRKVRGYVEGSGSPWFILSAKYGLVSPDQILSPYDETLNRMPVALRRDWAARVERQLDQELPSVRRIVFLAGLRYREFLEGALQRRFVSVEIPMEGLKIGKQLQWLGHHVGH
jgi:hypothetical protein